MQSVSYQPSTDLPDINDLKSLQTACPRAAFFTLIPKLDPEDTDSASEDEDEVNYIPEPITSLHQEEYSSLSKRELQGKSKEILLQLSRITQDQILELEKLTREQAICPLWFEHRRGRITGSIAHELFRRKATTPPENLLRKIMGYDSKDLSKVKPIKWGTDNEDKARDQYVRIKSEEHESFECRHSGFLIDEKRPYIGASADGIATCNCCKPRVLEIKCPYKYKDVDPMEAARIDSKFCLDEDGNLKTTHQYYTQLQLEIHVNHLFGVEVGDLCVYTNKCIHIVEDIKYDKDYVEQLLGKCESFFHSYLLPEILTRSLDRIDSESEIDEEGSAQPLFCICNRPEYGKMIECDNVSCDIGWFHFSCVGVRRKPKGEWYCPECKSDE